jgi:hypothetical protein
LKEDMDEPLAVSAEEDERVSSGLMPAASALPGGFGFGVAPRQEECGR